MLCDKCSKNSATTHIRSVINGVARELNLCAACAKEEGYANISHMGLTGMLASMFEEGSAVLPGKNAVCANCGCEFSDIVKKGKVGCADCYSQFSDELMPYLKRLHGSTFHAGKIPNSAPLMVVPKIETVNDLKAELARLVREEKFEQAAIVRDKIKELEEKQDD